jgi:8-oxo-dGTP pyrophosphatase MutT (NUDIX family)
MKAAGILFIADSGRALFLRRVDTGEWSLPGGVAEEGEDLAACAVRECVEETAFNPGTPGVIHCRQIKNGVDYTTWLRRISDEFTPRLNAEHDAYLWIEPKQALQMAAGEPSTASG